MQFVVGVLLSNERTAKIHSQITNYHKQLTTRIILGSIQWLIYMNVIENPNVYLIFAASVLVFGLEWAISYELSDLNPLLIHFMNILTNIKISQILNCFLDSMQCIDSNLE